MFGIHRPGVILETYFSFSEMCTYSISKYISFLFLILDIRVKSILFLFIQFSVIY